MKSPAGGDLKQREWHWCRRHNGFSAQAKWHVLGERLKMPAYQVIAFVNRLDEIANSAELRGQERGTVGDYSPDELAKELGMRADDAARIYAALEDGVVPWISDGYVTTFQTRNRDREDPTGPLRDRRRNTRNHVLKELARLGKLGRIDPVRRAEIEASLKLLADAELFELPTAIARLELAAISTAGVAHGVGSVGHTVGHAWPTRGTVGPTPEKREEIYAGRPVDKFGDGASAGGAGLGEEASAALTEQESTELWLATEGVRIIAERLSKDPAVATTLMLRWRDQSLGGDAQRLMQIIRGADQADYIGPRFHNLIVDGMRQAQREGVPQRELPMPPVPVSERKLG